VFIGKQINHKGEMKMNESIQFLISVLERTGEVVAHSKKEAEIAVEFLEVNATITDNGNGVFLVKVIKEVEEVEATNNGMLKTTVSKEVKRDSWKYIIKVEGQKEEITRSSKTKEYTHAVIVWDKKRNHWGSWSFTGRLDLAEKAMKSALKVYDTVEIVELAVAK
jgi:hypothetical protein